MISVRIDGVERAVKNLFKYSQEINTQITRDIQRVGDRVLGELRTIYPEFNIQGLFSPNSKEYQVNIEGIIVCSINGQRIATTTERLYGRKRGRGETPFTGDFNFDLLVKDILDQAVLEISQSLHMILKWNEKVM